jgi:hypothetical protein
MAKYLVIFTETVSYVVEVDAPDEEAAETAANAKFKAGLYETVLSDTYALDYIQELE